MKSTNRHVLHCIDEVRNGRKRLAVWGANDFAILALRQIGLRPDLVVDADWTRWGREFMGCVICSPEHLLHLDPQAWVTAEMCGVGAAHEKIGEFLDRNPGLARFQPILPPSSQVFQAARRVGADFVPNSALLLVEKMHTGGAERQLCNLAAGLVQLGWTVQVAVLETDGDCAWHYIADACAAGAEFSPIPPATTDEMLEILHGADAQIAALLRSIPYFMAPSVLRVLRRLQDVRPEVLVCHLDRPNVIGGAAGTAAGVPRILMSGRNAAPIHFPHFYAGQCEHFQALYQALDGVPGAILAVNSNAGAESYSAWLGRCAGDVPVILNSVDPIRFKPMTAAGRRSARAILGLPQDGLLLLGVFRLAPEKRPLLFIEAAILLLKSVPHLHVALCGDGMNAAHIRQAVQAAGMSDRVTLIRQLRNVETIMAAADLLLHTSEFEGTPNALLEAQCSGLPVVCAANGASEAVLAPELAPYALPGDDPRALADCCLDLLNDAALRRRLGRAAARAMRRLRSPAFLARQTLKAVGVE